MNSSFNSLILEINYFGFWNLGLIHVVQCLEPLGVTLDLC